ncbi:protein translocase SEC61 complex subunit gamma [Candidatus Micrarchaeota archaeon]|nr:protein translocase SEC61 complex subunit gamma [Candidatus Micrarchaeota archaeon]
MVSINFPELPGFLSPISDFAKQSERVLNATHKPDGGKFLGPEFRQIAYVTAIGMLLIGATGFVMSMVALLLKNFR